MATYPKIDVGMTVAAKPPVSAIEADAAARDLRLDSWFAWDHLQDSSPAAVWGEECRWRVAEGCIRETLLLECAFIQDYPDGAGCG